MAEDTEKVLDMDFLAVLLTEMLIGIGTKQISKATLMLIKMKQLFVQKKFCVCLIAAVLSTLE